MNHPGSNFLKPRELDEEKRTPRRWSRFVIAGALVLVVVSGTALIKNLSSAETVQAESDLDGGDFTPSFHRFFRSITSIFKGGNLEGEKRDRINVLLLGQGGPGHDGPFLTDTIILGSIKPSTGEVSLLSIPRDTAAPIPGYGWFKINHANHFGEQEKPGKGGAFAAKVVSDVLDEPIDYYVRVDFTAFEEVIEEVGGVDIQVDRSFVDQQYPDGPNKHQVVAFDKGAQHMNGDLALKYARSRHGTNGEGSDFARAARQQKVILGLKEKVLSLGTITNPGRIKRILNTLKEHIATDASVSEMVRFASLAQSIDTANIKTHVLTNAQNGLLKNATVDGAFLLVPRAGETNYTAIAALVDGMFDNEAAPVPLAPEPTAPPSALHVAVYNGTWRGGLAGRWQKVLQEQSFAVPVIGNTIERPLEKTQLILRESDKAKAAKRLSDIFEVDIITATSTILIEEIPEVSVLLLLGDDTVEPF